MAPTKTDETAVVSKATGAVAHVKSDDQAHITARVEARERDSVDSVNADAVTRETAAETDWPSDTRSLETTDTSAISASTKHSTHHSASASASASTSTDKSPSAPPASQSLMVACVPTRSLPLAASRRLLCSLERSPCDSVLFAADFAAAATYCRIGSP